MSYDLLINSRGADRSAGKSIVVPIKTWARRPQIAAVNLPTSDNFTCYGDHGRSVSAINGALHSETKTGGGTNEIRPTTSSVQNLYC